MKDDISRELLFVQSLEKVRQTAKEQGNCIHTKQVGEVFATLDLSDSQLQMVYQYLAKNKIRVDGQEDIEAIQSMEVRNSIEEKNSVKDGHFMEGALTKTERDYLQVYLGQIAALPVYSEEELEAYAVSAMAGDTEAQKRLAEGLLGDVVDIAKLYIGQGVFLEDLIGEGNVALAMGLEGLCTTSQGALTGGHSISEVRGMLAKQVMDAMEEFIQENAVNAKADQKVAEQVNLVADKAKELAEALRRKVTPGELAQETELSIEEIQDAMRMSGYKIEEINAVQGG